MRSCDNYQARMFDHLYGLLDAEEGLELIEHAGRCEACRAALLQADGQRKLMAAAAKAEFPHLRFEAPAAVALLNREAQKARRASLGLPRHAGRYAAAAALLLALAGLSVPVVRYANDNRARRNEVAVQEKQLDDLAKEERQIISRRDEAHARAMAAHQAAATQFNHLKDAQQKELDDAADALLARRMYMVVTGHETLRPGVPNEYRIEIKNMKGERQPASLDINLRDLANNQVILNRSNVSSEGAYTLSVPSDLPLRASDQVALEVVARTPNGPQGTLREELTLAKSSYVTRLVTDKPMYQPGETVRFRSLTLDRFSLRPATENFHLVYTVVNPQGNQVFQMHHSPRLFQDGKELLGPDGKPLRGIGVGEFLIPADLPEGGEFVLQVEEVGKKFPPERRKFLVNRYQKHRLNKELKFHEPSYGPGAVVVANCEVKRAEGGQPLAALPVTAVVRVDGDYYQANGQKAANHEAARMPAWTDAEGKVRISFQLPAQIDKGDASLTVEFTDEAVTEPLVRPIPVVVKKLNIEFFPEGGDLVAGLPNRVYFQARTPLNKPAHVEGALVDDKGQIVTPVRTLNDDREPGINQGMGVFQFTPQMGVAYQLKLDKPAGIEGRFVLPAAVAAGVVLSVPTGVSSDQDAISVLVSSAGRDRDLHVGAYCRGALLDFQEVHARQGQPTQVSLKPSGGAGGVYRLTVFEKQGKQGERLRPLAERLVYRTPAARLHLAIRADQKVYAPGQRVKLHLSANAEQGQPAPAVLLVGVVDKSVLKMADERTARALPTHFLLTSEVRHAEDLEFTDVLLGDHPLASQALDLLLGTQGWRRFIESDPERFQRENNDPKKLEDARCKADVARLRVVTGKLNLDKKEEEKVFTSFEVRQEQVLAKYKPDFEQVEARLNNAEVAIAQLRDTSEFEAEKSRLRQRVTAAQADYRAAFLRLEESEAYGQALQQRALLAFGVVLFLAGAGSVVVGLLRIMPRAVPLYIGSAAALGVSGLVVLGTLTFENAAPDQSPLAALCVQEAAENKTPLENGAKPGGGENFPVADHDAKGGMAGNGGEQKKTVFGKTKKLDEFAKGKELEKEWRREAAGRPNRAPNHNDGNFAAAKTLGKPVAAQTPMPFNQKAPPAPPPMDGAQAGVEKRGIVPRGEGRQMAMARNHLLANQMLQRTNNFPNNAGPGNLMRANQNEMQQQDQMDRTILKQSQSVQMRAIRNTPTQERLRNELNNLPNNADKEGMLRKSLQEAEQLRVLEPCIVREYAYAENRDAHAAEVRSDFAETLYWHPALVLANGQADLGFDLCDSETTFQVVVAGHTMDGRLGAATADLVSRKPFSLGATVPLEVTANDTIDLPVVLANRGDESRRVRVDLTLHNLALTAGTSSASRQEIQLAPGKRARMLFRVRPTVPEGIATITLQGTSEPFGADTVRYSFRIAPEGFPTAETRSDLLEGIARHDMDLPREWVRKTLRCELQVYPSSLADLRQGLEGLLREPNGCFEQTSTSNYPNVMILKYLRESRLEQQQPEIAERAKQLLSRGYQKLVSFECRKPADPSRQGYEWFGGTAPPHEALTAYGLLQFRDMAKVGQPVDPDMIERTRRFLASRKDGKGGFLRNPRAIDQFGRAPEAITNAYIVWALTESDKDEPTKENLRPEIDALVKQARDPNSPHGKDPYFLALVANSLLNRSMTEPAAELLKKLTDTQKPEGYLAGAQTSITGSGGRDLQIEATALGMLAWLKANRPEFQVHLRSAAKWIGQQRGGSGAFGSTQATILALKALIGYAKISRRPMEAGTVTLSVNGQVVATKNFTADLKEALILTVPDAEKHLKPGSNHLEIAVTGNNVLPYALTCSYQALTPKNPAAPPVKLATRLDRNSVRDGETVHLNVRVENASGRGQGMAVAVIGLPAGLNLPENMEQLKNLAKPRDNGDTPGKISAFEVRNRELVLYWRDLAPQQKIELNLDLVCRVPGEFRGPASRAYLYYNADHKHWIDPVRVTVSAE